MRRPEKDQLTRSDKWTRNCSIRYAAGSISSRRCLRSSGRSSPSPRFRWVHRRRSGMAAGQRRLAHGRGRLPLADRRWDHRRGRLSHRVSAPDRVAVPLHRPAREFRLHGARRLLDGRGDVEGRAQRQIVPATVQLVRLRHSRHHGNTYYRLREGTDGDDLHRAVDELLGSPAGLFPTRADALPPPGGTLDAGARAVRHLHHRDGDRLLHGQAAAQEARPGRGAPHFMLELPVLPSTAVGLHPTPRARPRLGIPAQGGHGDPRAVDPALGTADLSEDRQRRPAGAAGPQRDGRSVR